LTVGIDISVEIAKSDAERVYAVTSSGPPQVCSSARPPADGRGADTLANAVKGKLTKLNVV
jgi:hypothetical protein